MTLSGRTAAFVVAVVAVIALGFLAGRLLHSGDTQTYAFDFEAAPYEGSLPAAGLSKGGFTGFGETPGLPGKTILSGQVVSVSAAELVIEDADGTRTNLRLANPEGIARIEAAGRSALVAGTTIVVRHGEGSDLAEAVLILESP